MNLTSKLGVKPGLSVYTLHAPIGYQNLLPQPKSLDTIDDLPCEVDWLQAFYGHKSQLESDISLLKSKVAVSGQLWLSWPKKSSGLESDLSDSVVRSIGLAAGLVDVKVAAVDDIWSGLKFVYRLKDR